jgi:hypothetical protein
MTDPTPNIGRFVTTKSTREAVTVDCYDWVDTSDGWTFGRFETDKVTREAITVDCSNWTFEPSVWLEIRVSFDVSTDPTAVEGATTKLVRALDQMAPELRLVYDAGRSRTTEDGDVVVAIVPRTPADADARLSQLLGRVRTALKAEPVPLKLVGAGLRFAA